MFYQATYLKTVKTVNILHFQKLFIYYTFLYLKLLLFFNSRKRNSPKRPNNPGGVNRELKFNTRAEKWLKKDMTSQHSLQLREFNRLMSHSRELKDKIQRHASSASQSGGKNYFDGLSCKELSDVLVAMHPTCQVVRALAKKLKTAKPE